MSGWWWWPADGSAGERPVLFFPPAGADQNVVRPLLPHIGDLRLGVLRLPGRGPRAHEDPPTALAGLVAAIADAAAGLGGPPPVLVGHSFGGLLAYAVASRLQDRGRPVARLVALASSSPPAWMAELAADRAAHPAGGRAGFAARRSARILRDGGVPAEIAAHPELRSRVLATAAVDAGLAFDGFGTSALRSPVTAIRARDDRWVDAGAVAGWADVAGGGYDAATVPGGHFFYRDHPERLATRLRLETTLY